MATTPAQKATAPGLPLLAAVVGVVLAPGTARRLGQALAGREGITIEEGDALLAGGAAPEAP